LAGHEGGVWTAELQGNLLVSGSTDRTVRVWNLSNGDLVSTLPGHSSTVRCLALKDEMFAQFFRFFFIFGNFEKN
jgi:WD40 repeat protein